eukprot:TRINITY_DN1436_c1_g1_i10.p1 TRINITY_DN1436_c1_g1~~TRINITY_DN1436_c1_g1_i10.p1  ORF type:complete len:541 (-),score=107.87 TRINITY_DN1436_c1_g1_i10:54-1676(-)
MSDDFAGATLMSAGGCAPDVFSALIGVCITHSDIGVGTVVGSLLFNHLGIIGACGLLAGTTLHLSLRLLFREMLFYSLSIVVLLLVLYDSQFEWWECLGMVLLYGVYVFVCAIYTPLLNKFERYLPSFCREPTAEEEPLTKEHKSFTFTLPPGDTLQGGTPVLQTEVAVATAAPQVKLTPREVSQLVEQSNMDAYESAKAASVLESGVRLGFDYADVIKHGFLFKKSVFYTKMRVSSRQWQKRWFMLGETFCYCRNPLFSHEQRRIIDLSHATRLEIDPNDLCTFHIVTPTYTYTMRALDASTSAEWVIVLADRIRYLHEHCPCLVAADDTFLETEDLEDTALTWPVGVPKRVLYVVQFPLALSMALTIPDVRKLRWRKFFVVTFLMVLVWLAVMAYGMVWAAMRFACVAGIPFDIMGLTVLAIGASLPSCFSSVLAARQGFAAMAVSNAFGSNVFSILFSLGFPCLVETLFIHPLQPYVVQSSSITLSTLVLVVSLLIFIAVMAVTRLRLNRAVGLFCLLLYAALLTAVVVLSQLHVLS